MIAPTPFYKELNEIRGKDNYGNLDLKEELLEKFFPKSPIELTHDLSNVTAAFYGFLLLKSGDLIGYDKINSLSEQLFFELGKLKTNQAVQKVPHLPKDTRAFAIVAISAIFNASPEYQFSIEKFTEEHTIIILTGEDRYHKIASALGLSKYLTWPTLKPFMQAIKSELNLTTRIETELILLNDKSETICKYEFKN